MGLANNVLKILRDIPVKSKAKLLRRRDKLSSLAADMIPQVVLSLF